MVKAKAREVMRVHTLGPGFPKSYSVECWSPKGGNKYFFFFFKDTGQMGLRNVG